MDPTQITTRLYTSHFLSAWNSRTFEFGAVLFLASIYPGSLLYASIYALLRSLSSILFSSSLGSLVDRTDRLVSIRYGILSQRISVIISCALLWVLLKFGHDGFIGWVFFAACILLAGVEKVASLAVTVSVERDWVIVVSDDQENPEATRAGLNVGMRRIDLGCKLVAPVAISLVDALAGTPWAIFVVGLLSAISTAIEYFAIKRVYEVVPALAARAPPSEPTSNAEHEFEGLPQLQAKPMRSKFSDFTQPWVAYVTSPAFLPSLALSLLYLTVLSTGVHWQTYLMAVSYTPLAVSLFRALAVMSELGATLVAPMLMSRIGPIRGGLWSINWQVLMLAPAVAVFYYMTSRRGEEANAHLAAAVLTAGIILSRLGLFSFDLSVQFLIQDRTDPTSRSSFSSCEVALQSFFELLSFAATIVFPKPEQFVYPVAISFSAVALASGCFAGFVRKERGHLVHVERLCLGREKLTGREDDRGGYERVEEALDDDA